MMEKPTVASAAKGTANSGHYVDYAMEAALLEAQQKKHSQGVPGTHEPFPVQLHWVLEQTEKDGLSHAVRWAPHGRAFVVHQRELFVQQVLPVYFNQTKFTSFQRQLSLYGFRRLSKGPDRGGYYHPKFLRISRTFTRNITRTKVKNEGPRKAATPEAEPDFYKMPKLSESITQANSSTGRRPSADQIVPTQLSTAAHLSAVVRPIEPAQYVPPARLNNNYPLDASESRLAYQATIGSPLLSSRLPIPELDRARLLTSQLQQQTDAMRPGMANFAGLPSAHFLRQSLQPPHNATTWLSPSGNLQTVASPNVPAVPNLALQPNRPIQRSLGPLSGDQAVLYGNQHASDVRGPSPSLSDAIARILGTNSTSNPSLPPGNPDPNRGGSRGGP